MNTSKVTIILSIILVAILGTGLFTWKYLENSSIKLASKISDIQTYTKQGDWENAGKSLIDFEEGWNNTKKVWPIFLDHTEIDNIDEAYFKVKMYVQEKEIASLLAESAVLENYIKHIPEKESFNLKNIL